MNSMRPTTPIFFKIGKLSTCGFTFTLFGMVEGIRIIVVIRRIL